MLASPEPTARRKPAPPSEAGTGDRVNTENSPSAAAAGPSALCLCSTHLQLVNIAEYIAEHRIPRAHLVVLESEAVDRGITDFASDYYPERFTRITRVVRPSQKGMRRHPRRWLATRRQFLDDLRRAIDAAGPVDLGIFGHGAEIYAGTAYRLAGRPPVVIVDDGTDTYRYLSDAPFRRRQQRTRRWNLKRFLFGSALDFVDRARFYTLVPPDRIEGPVDTRQNHYHTLRAALTARPVVQAQHIIGQHLVEIESMSAADYRAQIAALCAHFPGPSRYFPHPGETADNLRHIESIPGLEIRRINQPYELYFLGLSEHPCRLSSFCTTAFITLSSWIADQRIDFVYVDARPLLTRAAIVERAHFAYAFTADNPCIRLLPPFAPASATADSAASADPATATATADAASAPAAATEGAPQRAEATDRGSRAARAQTQAAASSASEATTSSE